MAMENDNNGYLFMDLPGQLIAFIVSLWQTTRYGFAMDLPGTSDAAALKRAQQ